jgi:hypothetical protein
MDGGEPNVQPGTSVPEFSLHYTIMKTTKQLAAAVLATLGALAFSGTLLSASDVDDRIEAAAKKTYVNSMTIAIPVAGN